MKAPRKVASVKLSPRQAKEKREKDALERLMASVKEDQVWKHESGTEYVTILLSNRKATKPNYPVTVNYYGPDGEYWAQTLDRFVLDKVFLRNHDPEMTVAEDKLGGWLSAALEDPEACVEFKEAVKDWFNELPLPTLATKP